jgi:23S rRNA (pseudouridine1915-N3)-methyltransferase
LAAALSLAADSAVPSMTFVIGGPDGLGPSILAGAHRRWSFGRLTWPHQIARILLAEQLYRATTILSGHPYHRA